MSAIKIFHFMPDKLNLYGDIGNIIALKQRAKWRNIKVEVVDIIDTEGLSLDDCDIFFIGGGSDREQSLATEQLKKIKTQLKDAIEDGLPTLTICGGYQFLGSEYVTPDGTRLEGLNILDIYTESKNKGLLEILLWSLKHLVKLLVLRTMVVVHIMNIHHLVKL